MGNFNTMFDLPHTKSEDMVLVFYGHIRDRHMSSLRTHTYILAHSFCGSGVQEWFSRVFCSGSPKIAVKVSTGLCFHLEAQPGDNLLLSSFHLLANFITLWS